MNDIKFMKDLDARFRATSGLDDRRFFSIFYSRVVQSPLMLIGINPGGNTDGTHQQVSCLYEDYAHEYVDMNYRIAVIMRAALMAALQTTDKNDLRRIPKTNTIFHRSPATSKFTRQQYAAHLAMCAPFLAEIIAFVQPETIVLEGIEARDNLVFLLGGNVRTVHAETVKGLRRRRMNRFFQKDIAFLKPLGREVTLLTLGHPSHFGHLPTWPKAVEGLRRNLAETRVRLSTERYHAAAGAFVPSVEISRPSIIPLSAAGKNSDTAEVS